MLAQTKEKKTELIDKVAGLVQRRIPANKAAAAERFVRLYYGSMPPEDLAGRTADDLYGAAISHWSFAQARKPGAAKVRVYNPSIEDHGWQSTHSIVETVNDDMPFLVDSVTAELNRQGLTVHLVIHPIFHIKRDAQDRLVDLDEPRGADEGAGRESFIHLEVDRRSAREALETVEAGVAKVLADVRVVIEDWRPMLERLTETTGRLEGKPPPVSPEQVREVGDFLRWLGDGHFTFLGYCEYALVGEDGDVFYKILPKSGLGLLRDPSVDETVGPDGRMALPPEVKSFVHAPRILMITKSKMRSTVHRPVPIDCIGVKVFDPNGQVVGERRFGGLFTSTAYNRSPLDIPLLRRRVMRTLERAGLAPDSHDGKALLNILETFPRDELFQASGDELFEISQGILHLQERRRTRLFVRRDPYERYVSCLVYVPRDRYTTDLRVRMQEILSRAFDGTGASFTVQVSDAPLARLHIVIETKPGEWPERDVAEIEAQLSKAAQTWSDGLKEALIESFGEERGLDAFQRYGQAFPTAYREEFAPPIAVLDIEKIDSIEGQREGAVFAMNLYGSFEQAPGMVKFKLFHPKDPVPLSDILPLLENMGFQVVGERPFLVESADGRVWIHDFNMVGRQMGEIDLSRLKENFHEAFTRVWTGEVENDGFNRLVLEAALGWREVVVLRAYCKYLRQVGIPFSQEYMEETLARNSALTRSLVELFLVRFDPARASGREDRARELKEKILAGLDAVASLDEDRILRRYLNLIEATLRTNYFQTTAEGLPKPTLAFKLDSRELDELPLPRPFVEIFIYTPRMEGIHLRGGKVARGGIRWSERREDFRTEILGLMKAQMVKNAVIVPVGAKGGFVCKSLPQEAGREAVGEEVRICYEILIEGLLDLTDNLSEGAPLPPPRLVRYDGDDPYLVVAADRGTAAFSDVANEISLSREFWLGDAFASGGATGYDHKKLGITARGVWVSVTRHFCELGQDVAAGDFTVVGIGGMAGDVFGNGMLLSRNIKLIAAFDHSHIFIDPDPDPAESYAERERLFGKPRCAWSDYDPKLISPGGGVFDRKAKSIPLSAPVKERFGIERDALTPHELIRALLLAPVDLFWLGGIGTFVKASDESHAEVGDRANDALRVDAKDLRCRVVGEGANLGFTQRARIEYALKGGRINTDAIDNSGGVDCSDNEVNIKIVLDQIMADGEITAKQRNKLLADMTDEVAGLVLRHNYLQGQALSISEANAPDVIETHGRLIRALERDIGLDRAVECLPDEEELAEREKAGRGLTRPEIAVLLGYAKIDLFTHLLETDVASDPFLAEDLTYYFPAPLREGFARAIKRHRLRQEIIATSVANSLINRAGPGFVHRIAEETGAGAADVARAYAATRQIFDLRSLWGEIEALDNSVPAALQIRMFRQAHRLVQSGTLWFLRHGERPLDIAGTIAAFEPGVSELSDGIEKMLAADELEDVEASKRSYRSEGAPESLARRIAMIDGVIPACGIVLVAKGLGYRLEEVGRTYYEIGVALGFDWLRTKAASLAAGSHWQRRAVTAIVDDLYSQQTALAGAVLKAADGTHGVEAIDAWIDLNRTLVEQTRALLRDFRGAEGLDLSMLAVANRQMRALIVS